MKNLYLALLLLAGCSGVTQNLTSSVEQGTFYKRDMIINVNGKSFDGVGVVPYSGRYDFSVDAKGKLNLFTYATCHRDLTKENAFEKGWFKDKSKTKFSLVLFDEEESGISCPLQLGGYELSKGRHSWGFIDFEHSSLKAKAVLKCNGDKRKVNGVGVCQSRFGLIQFLIFEEPMLSPSVATCPKWQSVDGKYFSLEIPKGQCTYRFKGKISGDNFRITTLGYENILIRDLD